MTRMWGDHLIPLTVFVGPKAHAGEGLVAFGANHGNEYEGPMVLKRLMNEIRSRGCTWTNYSDSRVEPGRVRRWNA